MNNYVYTCLIVFVVCLAFVFTFVECSAQGFHHFGLKSGQNLRRLLSMDSCDWTGSGLAREDDIDEQTVESAYIRGCSGGRIKWQYPRGAVRIVIQFGKEDFRGCVRFSRHSSGASVFVEGKRGRLLPLFSARDHRPVDLVRCFTSYRKKVVLYLEADPSGAHSLQKKAVELRYALRENPNDDSECRPCSDKELLRASCTADFAFIGTVTSMYENSALERTEFTVRSSEILRDSVIPLFVDTSMDNERKWTIPSASISSENKMAVLHRPSRCGSMMGSGDFVFFGRWILGNPEIQCVPRLDQWQKVRRNALLTGTNVC